MTNSVEQGANRDGESLVVVRLPAVLPKAGRVPVKPRPGFCRGACGGTLEPSVVHKPGDDPDRVELKVDSLRFSGDHVEGCAAAGVARFKRRENTPARGSCDSGEADRTQGDWEVV